MTTIYTAVIREMEDGRFAIETHADAPPDSIDAFPTTYRIEDEDALLDFLAIHKDLGWHEVTEEEREADEIGGDVLYIVEWES